MAEFLKYEDPEPIKGDLYPAKDHVGATVLLKVKQRKEGIVTENTPEPGGPGIITDLVDLDTDKVYRDVLFMGGSFVDGLTRYLGGLVVVTIVKRKSQKSSREYTAPEGAGDEGIARGKKWIDVNGDPFAPAISTPSKEDPPF